MSLPVNRSTPCPVALVSLLCGFGVVCLPLPQAAIANNANSDSNFPEKITSEFQTIRFTADPYSAIDPFRLTEQNKLAPQFRTVTEEANLDAPKSESYNSGFKIRIGLDEFQEESPPENSQSPQ